MEYIFVHGRNPELSILELFAFFNRKNIKYNLSHFEQHLSIFSIEKLPFIINELGGTIKIGEEIQSIDDLNFNKNKVTYSITAFQSNHEKINNFLKKKFRDERIKFVCKSLNKENREISPTRSLNLDLELVLFKNKIFKIIQVSNPKEYKKRDTSKFSKEPHKITSIRLAKILINLSEAKREILDPFCGTGAILQEALLMSYNVMGVDKDISEAKINLENLGEKHKGKWKLIQADATKISKYIKNAECVVTEPYLGPYLKKLPTKQEAKNVADELRKLYEKLISELSKIVQGKIVIIIPRFKTKNKDTISINFEEIINQCNLKIISPFEKIKNPVLYSSPDSKIERLIYILKK